MKLQGIRDTWANFSRGTKRLFRSMILLGIFLLSFGIVADLSHASWLEGHALIPNILAGFIGFLFGVPVALVGLSTIADQRERKAQFDRVDKLSRLAWNDFKNAAFTLCNKDRQNAINEYIPAAWKIYEKICTTIADTRELVRGQKPDEPFEDWMVRILARDQIVATPEESSALREKLGLMASELESAVRKASKAVGGSHELTEDWTGVIKNWNSLDTYVRLQRLEQGLRWLDDQVDTRKRVLLSSEDHPFAEYLIWQNGGRTDLSSVYPTLRKLQKILQGDKDQFDAFFFGKTIGNEFDRDTMIGYQAAAATVSVFIVNLQSCIASVDLDGWPDSTAS